MIDVYGSKHQASDKKDIQGGSYGQISGTSAEAMKQWYTYKNMGVDTEAEKQEHESEKHTGPLAGQITISEKKYRKVTMKRRRMHL